MDTLKKTFLRIHKLQHKDKLSREEKTELRELSEEIGEKLLHDNTYIKLSHGFMERIDEVTHIALYCDDQIICFEAKKSPHVLDGDKFYPFKATNKDIDFAHLPILNKIIVAGYNVNDEIIVYETIKDPSYTGKLIYEEYLIHYWNGLTSLFTVENGSLQFA